MSELPKLKAPFPWFGGKSLAGPSVWQALGEPGNYIEPFAGSLGALLTFPRMPNVVTLNDADGYLVNFWRAVQAAPNAVAEWADWPVSELDLTARHVWLVTSGAERISRLQSDPAYFDAQVAGWWVWGLCSWIGAGWCAGTGPWRLVDNALVKAGRGPEGHGEARQLPYLAGAGRGISKRLPHLSTGGMGVHRKLARLGDAGCGINRGGHTRQPLVAVMRALSDRLRSARMTCGDWKRVLTPAVRRHSAVCGIFLDPPYLTGADLYRTGNDADIALEVRQWAIDHAHEPRTRIVLAGYDGEYSMPSEWTKLPWQARGPCYGSSKGNYRREVLWLSPQCVQPASQTAPDQNLEVIP